MLATCTLALFKATLRGMQITRKQLKTYQKHYFTTFGIKIDSKDALIECIALLRLVKVLSNTGGENGTNK